MVYLFLGHLGKPSQVNEDAEEGVAAMLDDEEQKVDAVDLQLLVNFVGLPSVRDEFFVEVKRRIFLVFDDVEDDFANDVESDDVWDVLGPSEVRGNSFLWMVLWVDCGWERS